MVVKTGALLEDAGYKVVAVMFFGEKEVSCFNHYPRPLMVSYRAVYKLGSPSLELEVEVVF